MMRYLRIKHFFLRGIWENKHGELSLPLRLLLEITRRLYLTIRFYVVRGHSTYATSLCFSTMLAIVPIIAIVFAIGKGFGMSLYIENWLRSSMDGQSQVAEWLISMSGSYLKHAKTGIIIGIGILFMLYSVISLVYSVESVFNRIWQVSKKRSFSQMLVGYTSMIFLVPIAIIVVSGVNIFVYGIVDSLQEFQVLGHVVRMLIKITPLIVMTGAFLILYTIAPNTKVQVKHTIIPAFVAAISMVILQYFYINGQILLSSYNAIYGSFAALPLFMLWMQASWYICLFGAELCYTSQNLEYYTYLVTSDKINQQHKILMSAVLLGLICKRFEEAKTPYTAFELKTLTGIPARVLADLLSMMSNNNLIVDNNGPDGNQIPFYQPAQDIKKITFGKLYEIMQKGNDALRYIDVHFEKFVNSDIYVHILQEEQIYSEKLMQIELTKLIK